MDTTVIKHAPTDIMGENVYQNANVTVHSSAIMCVDAYKGQIQRTTSQPTAQKLYSRIQSKPVFSSTDTSTDSTGWYFVFV